jgi:Bacteriophage protein of unknown function (DUF646).
MAQLTSTGLDQLMAEMSREVTRMEEKATEMLGEGGKVVVKAWQDVIEERGHVKTGEMKRSVRASAVKSGQDAHYTDIYPHGKDKKGVRNAEKAFILHYGTSKKRGDHWVDEAEDRAGDAAEAAMRAVWERD